MQKSYNPEISGIISNIQRYSVHDGPGIRTTVFLKGCPLRCFWCQNPETQDLNPVLMVNVTLCTHCGRCIPSCKKQAIYREEVTNRVITNRSICTGCGACVSSCVAAARKISGEGTTVGEVMEIVLRDYNTFKKSKGGLTLSGGEATMQPEFAAELLKAGKEEWLHTAIETCGLASSETLLAVTEYADLVLFDLKMMDPKRHQEGTRAKNDIILDNAKLLVQEKRNVLFRTPLIPGFNDNPEDVVATKRFVADELGLDPAKHIELLKYNTLGEGKYDNLGRAAENMHGSPQPDDFFEVLNGLLKNTPKRQEK